MSPSNAAREPGARHDWITPTHQPWVQSMDGGVRVSVPWDWSRRTVGEHALLVSPPDGSVTVGMVPGGVGTTFHTVMKRLVGSLTKARVLHRSLLEDAPLAGVVVEGMGVDGDATMEWFVARVGDASCGAVLYGIGARSRYDAHLAAMRAVVHSVRPVHSGAFPRAEGNYPPPR